ncbi:MAG: S8 family serine peptidase [Ilumatobacteraceae bacterium]
MATVAAAASKERPSWLTEQMDSRPHARIGTVVVAISLAVVISVGFGIWGRDRLYEVDTNVYVATAGLFVVALAIERMTELLVAPWVGRGDRRTDRNILVGSFALLIGVVVSGLLGLRMLALLSGDPADVSWLGASVEVFATGLAIGSGGKPLHDLITRLDTSVQTRKDASATADSPPPPAPDPAVGRAPAGGAYRMAVTVATAREPRSDAAAPDAPGADPSTSVDAVESTVATLLPTWNTEHTPDAPGSILVHTVTAAVPGSSAYIREVFSAAHRLHGAGFDVTVAPGVVRAGTSFAAPVAPRGALGLLGVDAAQQEASGGGAGIRVAVLDTGWLAHPDGVDPARVDRTVPGADVIGRDDDPTDPLIPGADWASLDVMGTPGHGTGVAAVIAAGGAPSPTRPQFGEEWWERSPMVGVAPLATIVPIRVMRGPVHLLDDDVAKGVDLAIAAGCHVISMSLGGLAFRKLAPAINRAVEAGIVVVCAAGNEVGVVIEPASYPNTIAVAGVTLEGQPYFEGSSRGPEVTVSAPGVDVLRPDFELGPPPRPLLDPGVGTTYATAHISGLAALWLSHHGVDALRAAYPGDQVQRVFAHLVATTARPWPVARPELPTDWGPGIADGGRLLAAPLIDAGGPVIDRATLDGVFSRKTPMSTSDRLAGALASVLAADGSAELRANAFRGLLALRSKLEVSRDMGASIRLGQDQATRDRMAANAGALVRAEMQAHAGANPNYRRALASATDQLPVPKDATPELQMVVDESNRTARAVASGSTWDAEWGVGLSRPLLLALQGAGTMRKGYRRVGVIALLVAVAIAAVYAWWDTPGSDRSIGAVGGAVGLLGIGLYGGALAIERVLEFTIGRWAFKDTPGREMDRALILLGCGILLGCLVTIVLDAGLLAQVASSDPDDRWFHGADILVTALAIGGGAKPIHDLLTWIKLPRPA